LCELIIWGVDLSLKQQATFLLRSTHTK